MSDCTIIDLGVGNLHSLQKALERAGATCTVTSDPRAIANARRIVLPGVGAFGPAAIRLAPMASAITAHLQAGKPLLGICLGMQLLLEASEEAPGVPGLGWIPGTVQRLEGDVIPLIGWNQATGDEPTIDPGHHYYFVHSYGVPVQEATTSRADHGGTCSATIRSGSALGMQFHPEKSGEAGLAALGRWLA